jgi:hypothetical protein
MKKITLLLSLAFCFSLNAQVLTETFDGLALPAGWSNEYVSATVNWQFNATNQNGTVAPRTGAGMASFWSNSYAGNATRLVTASMDLSVLPSQVLNFYYTQEDWGGDQDELRVYYRISATDAWVELAAFTADTNPTWTEVNLVLPNPSADYYIAFEGTSGYGRGITVDDVVIDNAPNCLTPGSLSVFGTSNTTSGLNWIPAGTETDFTYEYGAPGFVVATGEELGTGSVTGNSAPVTGLTADTAYEFYVQANCGVDGDSGWAGPFAWTQVDTGDSCGAPIVATLEADCGTATPISLDFTGAPSNISTSCDTFNNYGLWVTATTDAAGGLTVNASAAVDMAIYDMCGDTDVACYGGGVSPSVSVVLSPNTQYYLYFWQETTTSTAMVDVCISSYTPAPAPDCAEAPITPTDGEMGVLIPDGNLTLTWTAPSTGPAPTDYELFLGETSGALASVGLLGSTDTTVDLINLNFEATYYWTIVPINGGTSAAGPCAEWSFTTEDAPPPPANDDCSTALNFTSLPYSYSQTDGTAATNNAGFIGDCINGVNDGVWFTFNPSSDGTIDIVTSNVSAGFDQEIAVYSGSCGMFTCVDNADATFGGEGESLLGLAVTSGVQYYINVAYWSGTSDNPEGNFDINVTGTVTLGVNSLENENSFTYFPNPVKNELTLNAQKDIQNVFVYNMLGQEVLRSAPNSVNSTISMNELSQGAYFVRVTIGNVTETIRVIKQ